MAHSVFNSEYFMRIIERTPFFEAHPELDKPV